MKVLYGLLRVLICEEDDPHFKCQNLHPNEKTLVKICKVLKIKNQIPYFSICIYNLINEVKKEIEILKYQR